MTAVSEATGTAARNANADYNLAVTVRLYGDGTAEDAAQALREYRSTFELPNRPAVDEVEIIAVQLDTALDHIEADHAALQRVWQLHQPAKHALGSCGCGESHFTPDELGPGSGWAEQFCIADQWDWPCPTRQALTDE